LTIAALADELADMLAARGVGEPRTQARDIITALAAQPRSWAFVRSDAALTGADCDRARAAAEMLARGAPFAYAVGRASFRHLTLEVDPRVLIPRPETELLVDVVFDELGGADAATGVAIDVGTGSGAIALALASEGRFSRVYATDISLDALAVARRNVERASASLRAPVELRHGSLLAAVRDVGADVIASNPPYIALGEAAELPRSGRDWEPPVALYGGNDGLVVTARLVREAADLLRPDGLLAIEVDARRASLVAELVARDSRFRAVRVVLDLTGRERFVLARRKEKA